MDNAAADFASRGGRARAEAMTPEERREQARRAVEARWGKNLTKATHEGVLHIAGHDLPCAVLENGMRVLTQSGFMVALGRARQAKGRQYYDGDVNLPAFLTAKNLKPFITDDLKVTSSQIEFCTLGGVRAFGYSSDLLPKVCWVFINARSEGVLVPSQNHIADRATVLAQGLTNVAIRALVDEATGFQYERPRRDLEEYLKKYLSENLRRWVRTFPSDYFKHLCRLRDVELRSDMKLPQYFGYLTNNLVYRRLAPGILKRLKERRSERGSPSNKMHSWLSADLGVPELVFHLGSVVTLMKLHTSYEEFEKQLDQVSPVYPETPGLFDDPKDWE
jgi:hypothetical protein